MQQMPQPMQPNATTNANKCKNQCNQMQSFASQMHQTYVELNVATYVYPIFGVQKLFGVVLWDKVNI